MFIEERHKLILECLEKNGSITTNDIMEQYSVWKITHWHR